MNDRTIRRAAWLLALGIGSLGGQSRAEPTSVSEGYRLADARCAVCHVIVADGPGSWTDAPPFTSIANRPGITRAWLAEFVQKPHMHMLTDYYTPAQANDIADYILSLRRK